MDFLAYVEFLREVQWGWSQDQVAAFILRSGWQCGSRTMSTAGHERRKYTNEEGCRWTVDSLEGQLVQLSTVFRWLEYDTNAASHVIEQYHAQLADEYVGCMTMLRSRLGSERHEGVWCEEAPCSWRCEDADRLAEWRFGAGTLTLCLSSGHLGRTRTPSGWLEGCWLEVMLYPNAVPAEPQIAPDYGGIT